ncbi:MAG: VUT family protein [Alphaproteobacteria bacterium]
MKNSNFIIACLAMGAIILASNILVEIPVNDWLTWGALSFPLCFLVTDTVNRFYGASSARKVVSVGFVFGVVLSLIFADLRIAIASGTSFFIAQMLDVTVFDKLRRGLWWKAPVVSSAISSTLDTALFFSIAFAGTGLPWVTWGIGDLATKYFMVVALIPVYRMVQLTFVQVFKLKEV